MLLFLLVVYDCSLGHSVRHQQLLPLDEVVVAAAVTTSTTTIRTTRATATTTAKAKAERHETSSRQATWGRYNSHCRWLMLPVMLWNDDDEDDVDDDDNDDDTSSTDEWIKKERKRDTKRNTETYIEGADGLTDGVQTQASSLMWLLWLRGITLECFERILPLTSSTSALRTGLGCFSVLLMKSPCVFLLMVWTVWSVFSPVFVSVFVSAWRLVCMASPFLFPCSDCLVMQFNR